MYTEIIRIIEGAIKKDVNKVISYTNLLVENLKKNGDSKTADRILKAINGPISDPVFRDQLMVAPVDQDSRMSMADIVMPETGSSEIILSDSLSTTMGDFIGLIKHRSELAKVGIHANASLLLYGPPGCGKTTVAKLIANELQLPLVVARLDSLVSSLLGNTAKNIRKLFDFCASKPCILLLDEFDAIGKARDDQHELGELKRVINSLLQNIDEFTANGNILIAATNHAELLDKAIWRRFNHVVDVGKPEISEMKQFLKSQFRNIEGGIGHDDKKLEQVAKIMTDLSFADAKTICNNAISKAIIAGKTEVLLEDVLIQLFLFKNNSKYEVSSLIAFLQENGSSRLAIAASLGIPYRQVSNSKK